MDQLEPNRHFERHGFEKGRAESLVLAGRDEHVGLLNERAHDGPALFVLQICRDAALVCIHEQERI
jgi:hypothetical protein